MARSTGVAMTNPTTDYLASSACSPRARDAVHRFPMPGLGGRSVHGLLGIFIKSYEEVPRGNSLERFYLALATFLKMSVRPCNLPKRMPGKARLRTDRGSALNALCKSPRSGDDATCPIQNTHRRLCARPCRPAVVRPYSVSPLRGSKAMNRKSS